MIFQQAPGWWIIRTKGWAEYPSPNFSMDGGGEGPYITALLLCCARFSIWALTLNVAPWAKAMMDSPSWQLPLFQRSTQDEMGGGGKDVWGQKPHVEWEAAKWSLHSSSSGPVVLEGWLLQANSKNCKPGNTSVQLGSLCGMKHTNPPASRGMRVRDKERNAEGKHRQRKVGCMWDFWLQILKAKLSLPWNQKQHSNGKGAKECKANLHGNSPSAIILCLSSCITHTVCLYLFSFRHN